MSRGQTTPNKISTNNVRAAADMAAGAVYQGTGEDVAKYGRVGVSITSSNKSNGTLTMEVSRDNVAWGGPNRTFTDTRFAQPHMWNIVEQYFRIKYTNGNLAAKDLAIQVQYSNNADIILGHQLDETLLDETEATIARAVLVGKTATGNYLNVPLSELGELSTKSSDITSKELLQEISQSLKIIIDQNNEAYGLNFKQSED